MHLLSKTRLKARNSSDTGADLTSDPDAAADITAKKKARGLLPDYFASSIEAVDFRTLHRQGVRHLVVDVDHTLAAYRSMQLDADTIGFLHDVKRDGLVDSITLASNSRRDLRPMAASIKADLVRPYFFGRKPGKGYYKRLLRSVGCPPGQAVMVGDKMVNDVWGANRLGMYTVLVNPIGPDMLFDRLLGRRFWGRQYVKRRQGSRP